MKKISTLLFPLLVLIGFLFASFPAEGTVLPLRPSETYTTEKEFFKHYPKPERIFGKEQKHDFLYYDQISALGELESITVWLDYNAENPVSYEYILSDAYCESIRVTVSKSSGFVEYIPISFRDTHSVQDLRRISKSDLNITLPPKSDEIEFWPFTPSYFTLEVGGATYVYRRNDQNDYTVLYEIIIQEGACSYSIMVEDSRVYSLDQEPVLMSRLFSLETAPQAIDELRAQLLKPRMAAWVLPTAIGGGAVVLAGAATATVVVIRRKKRGAAVTDTPAEEENA